MAAVTEQTRYHILVADPRLRILSQRGQTWIEDRSGNRRPTSQAPLELLRSELKPGIEHLPHFCGGALGYFSYEYGHLHGLPCADNNDFPEMAAGIYDWAVIVDQQQCQCRIVGVHDGEWPDAKLIETLCNAVEPRASQTFSVQKKPSADISRGRYRSHFQRIQQYLREGDCYQVNYAQRFSLPWDGDAWSIYLHMRHRNPAAYGAFLNYPFAQILSASPEQFLQVDGDEVTTRPIKGTRPRRKDQEADRLLALELLCSSKDQAENLMIVDLLRNDLGRVCEPGSICVPELFRLERQPTVQHLVSTVKGRLSSNRDALDLLAACFPGGSITGAPKYRAMEIIHELEAHPREIYCGSIGWIGYNGNMQTNIAIRSVQIRNKKMTYWAGGGIVADSDESGEYHESLDKAAAFFDLFNAS